MGGWLVNGKSLSSIESLPAGTRLTHIPDDENLRVHRKKICAAAWLQTQDSENVTQLLDLVLKFWKLASQPVDDSKYSKDDLQSSFREMGRAFHELGIYQRVFQPQWSRPVWLTEFRQAGQKIPLTPEEKNLAKTTAELAEKNAQLRKAESAARDNLQEALSKWMRFDPPRMSANTKARIEKAVKIYVTDPERRSLAKIATEFHVSRKTVSVWFEQFRKETGFRVVTFQRHESVRERMEAQSRQNGGE
jgi:ribosomal protein L9